MTHPSPTIAKNGVVGGKNCSDCQNCKYDLGKSIFAVSGTKRDRETLARIARTAWIAKIDFPNPILAISGFRKSIVAPSFSPTHENKQSEHPSKYFREIPDAFPGARGNQIKVSTSTVAALFSKMALTGQRRRIAMVDMVFPSFYSIFISTVGVDGARVCL